MNKRAAIVASLLTAFALSAWAASRSAVLLVAAASSAMQDDRDETRFEVWIADQSDTRPGFGGQLPIYEGSDLMGNAAANAAPILRPDLGADTAALCLATTGRNPVRPHMILFNQEHTHAIVSFVASGHVVIFDAAIRTPLSCFETTVSSSTGTRQAHAAFPAPDGSYILVANQNGKRLERIDTNFATNFFFHNQAATLDLATCTTPSGQRCEDAELRPINWPICPIIDSSSRYGFVTLRGGGLFVVDAKATPMTIVGEYDKTTVHGNGCGGVQVRNHMYINSGGSPARQVIPTIRTVRVRSVSLPTDWLLRFEPRRIRRRPISSSPRVEPRTRILRARRDPDNTGHRMAVQAEPLRDKVVAWNESLSRDLPAERFGLLQFVLIKHE